jgi:glycerophosphoryl diester phosphodiesterase
LLVAGGALLAGIGVALLALLVARGNQPVLVIAHRGASVTAPENTLAAFRLGVAEHANFVELDVQESLDGEVVVVHDSDLMKVGGSPMRVWEHTAAELRAVDIGSHKGPEFKDERVATLAEALATCKGSATGVLIEMKSYGHNERLEEKVAEIVEAAGMEKDCMYMSLDHYQVGRMKRLRPSWRVGVLVAKAFGDITSLTADFVAVEARMATARFVRRAHRAKQDVYVWTVNDPAWMLAALSHGVDGLITDRPALAREVVARRAEMSDAQRLLTALLVRAGARSEALEAEDALRP